MNTTIEKLKKIEDIKENLSSIINDKHYHVGSFEDYPSTFEKMIDDQLRNNFIEINVLIPNDNYDFTIGEAVVVPNQFLDVAIIDWGDGNSDQFEDGKHTSISHTYANAGNYTIKANDKLSALQMSLHGNVHDESVSCIQSIHYSDGIKAFKRISTNEFKGSKIQNVDFLNECNLDLNRTYDNYSANDVFVSCDQLTSFQLSASDIGDTVFSGSIYFCNNLSSINCPNLKLIPMGFIQNCEKLEYINLSSATRTAYNANYFIKKCINVKDAYLNSLSVLPRHSIWENTKLSNINLDSCLSIFACAIQGTNALTSLNLPSCTDILSGPENSFIGENFYGLQFLSYVRLPKIKNIDAKSIFHSHGNDVQLILDLSETTEVPYCNPQAFYTRGDQTTKLTNLSVLVSESMYDAYRNSEMWQIALDDYQRQIISSL